MNDIERKRNNLLVYLLDQINDALDGFTENEGLYTPYFRYEPVFEFDDEDVEAIKSFANIEPSCDMLVEEIERMKQ